MNNHYEIIKQAQRILLCPFCGKHYHLDQIQVRGIIASSYVLQAICSTNHAPVITLFVTSVKGKIINNSKMIRQEDLASANQALDQFNGDFEKLWKI